MPRAPGAFVGRESAIGVHETSGSLEGLVRVFGAAIPEDPEPCASRDGRWATARH
jgi:hypothetical protein